MAYELTMDDIEQAEKLYKPSKQQKQPEDEYHLTMEDLPKPPGVLTNLAAGVLQGAIEQFAPSAALGARASGMGGAGYDPMLQKMSGLMPSLQEHQQREQIVSPLQKGTIPSTIPNIQPLKAQIPQVPFGERGTPAYEVANLAGLLLPYAGGAARLAGSVAGRAPELINAFDKMLVKKGYTPSYLNRLRGKTLEPLQEQYQNHTSDMLSNFYGKDFQNQIGNEEQILANTIARPYNESKEISDKLYGNLKKSKGWNKNIEKPDIFNNVNEIYKVGEGRLGSNLTDKLNIFNKNPTAGNAHEVQSALGEQLRDYHELPYNYRPPKSVLNDLNKTRDSLRENIGNALGSGYKKASDFYKENIAPFHNDPTISNILRGKVPSAESMSRRIGKGTALEGEDQIAPEALKIIANKLRPGEKEKFILPFIKGSPGTPVVDTFGELNPDALLNKIKGLKTAGLEKFISEPMMNDFNRLNELNKSIEKERGMIEKSRKRASFIAKYVIPGAAAGGYGLHKFYE